MSFTTILTILCCILGQLIYVVMIRHHPSFVSLYRITSRTFQNSEVNSDICATSPSSPTSRVKKISSAWASWAFFGNFEPLFCGFLIIHTRFHKWHAVICLTSPLVEILKSQNFFSYHLFLSQFWFAWHSKIFQSLRSRLFGDKISDFHVYEWFFQHKNGNEPVMITS